MIKKRQQIVAKGNLRIVGENNIYVVFMGTVACNYVQGSFHLQISYRPTSHVLYAQMN